MGKTATIDLIRVFLRRDSKNAWVNGSTGIRRLWALLARDLFDKEIITTCGQHHFFNKGSAEEIFSLGRLFRLTLGLHESSAGQNI